MDDSIIKTLKEIQKATDKLSSSDYSKFWEDSGFANRAISSIKKELELAEMVIQKEISMAPGNLLLEKMGEFDHGAPLFLFSEPIKEHLRKVASKSFSNMAVFYSGFYPYKKASFTVKSLNNCHYLLNIVLTVSLKKIGIVEVGLPGVKTSKLETQLHNKGLLNFYLDEGFEEGFLKLLNYLNDEMFAKISNIKTSKYTHYSEVYDVAVFNIGDDDAINDFCIVSELLGQNAGVLVSEVKEDNDHGSGLIGKVLVARI